MIQKISLMNFRNYSIFCVNVNSKFVLISGLNGSGKTNLMEAVSMFFPGYGIKGDKFSEILQNKIKNDVKLPIEQKSWQVELIIKKNNEDIYLKSYYNTYNNKKSIVDQNGKSFKYNEIINFMPIIWIMPKMLHNFISNNSEKRKFLDRLIYYFDHEHLNDLKNYEKQLSNRLRLLKEDCKDEVWINTIESDLAKLCFKISFRRILIINLLNNNNSSISNISENFHIPVFALEGEIDNLLLGLFNKTEHLVNFQDFNFTLSSIILKYQEEYNGIISSILSGFKKHRKIDSIIKQSKYGIHKTQINIFNKNKNILADFSSTGEQKSVLTSLILLQIQLLLQYKKEINCVVLLLDDIMAHLDQKKRKDLILILSRINKLQIWISGTCLKQCERDIMNNSNEENLISFIEL